MIKKYISVAVIGIFSLGMIGCENKSDTHNGISSGASSSSEYLSTSGKKEEISRYDNIMVHNNVSSSYRDMMMKGMSGKDDRNAYFGSFDCSSLGYELQSGGAIKTSDSVNKTFTNSDASFGCSEETYAPNFSDYGDKSFVLVTKLTSDTE